MEAFATARGLIAVGRLALIGQALLQQSKDRKTRGRIEAVCRSWPEYASFSAREIRERVDLIVALFGIWLDDAALKRALEGLAKQEDRARFLTNSTSLLGNPDLCLAFCNDPGTADTLWRTLATLHHELELEFWIHVYRPVFRIESAASESDAAECVLARIGSALDYPPPEGRRSSAMPEFGSSLLEGG